MRNTDSVRLLLTTGKHLESLLQEEIQDICANVQTRVQPGQVWVEGQLEHAYQLCLWSRLANRVLLELGQTDVRNAEELYQGVSSIDWPAQFSVKRRFVVDFHGTDRQIKNTQFGALKVKDAIVDQFNQRVGERPSIDRQRPDIRVHCRLHRQRMGIFLDFGGHSLHMRHYRQGAGDAPLKEHIACAMLRRSGWLSEKTAPLWDPFCGSGTIAIEAALIAANIAPGLKRRFWGFSQWRGHNSELWQGVRLAAEKVVKKPKGPIFASDNDTKLLDQARENAKAAGVEHWINFSQTDARELSPQTEVPGFIVSNPPYGERLADYPSLLPLYQAFGERLKQHFGDWQLSLLCSESALLKALKLSAHKEYKLFNGKLECSLANYRIDAHNRQQHEAPSSDIFNRLSKNWQQRQRWLKQQDIDCYRLYDADLPDYNLAVDVYGEHLVVQEYAPPKEIPEAKARRRLQEAIIALPQVTKLPPSNIVLKVREKQKGQAQYQKLHSQGQRLQVRELGAKFWVNLTDYLDTGLFLDHRLTRQRVKALSQGKDVLNLFAYTGSVSVHAALGGADSVTSVDMSKTYLQWARDNFALNNILGPHRFIQADCLTWLGEHQDSYDLIFIDPPSFSNSKRMQQDWDVQRDYLQLLEDAKACLKPGGTLLFSNNLRSFKLDTTAVEAMGFRVKNISVNTLPEDFQRNPKIHQCWELSLER